MILDLIGITKVRIFSTIRVETGFYVRFNYSMFDYLGKYCHNVRLFENTTLVVRIPTEGALCIWQEMNVLGEPCKWNLEINNK